MPRLGLEFQQAQEEAEREEREQQSLREAARELQAMFTGHFAVSQGAKPDTSQFRRVRNRTLRSFAPGHYAARHSQRVSGGALT